MEVKSHRFPHPTMLELWHGRFQLRFHLNTPKSREKWQEFSSMRVAVSPRGSCGGPPSLEDMGPPKKVSKDDMAVGQKPGTLVDQRK